jgi:hypothetical protein
MNADKIELKMRLLPKSLRELAMKVIPALYVVRRVRTAHRPLFVACAVRTLV